MKQLLKVVSQKDPFTVQKQDGTPLTKCAILLQEIGSQHEDSYACTLLGNAAQCKFYPGDLVYVSLRFSAREYQGNFYQDITIQDIISFTQH